MNESVKSLITRNSCRSFKQDHLTREELDTLLAIGLNAPSGKNMQPVRFVAIQDEETIAQLRRMNAEILGTPDADPFYGAKDVIVVLSATFSANYLYDGSLAMGNLLNGAWAMGLGACWIHRAKETFYSEEGKALLKKWGIDEEVEGIGICIVGHPDQEKPKIEPKPGRVFYV